MVLVGVGTVAFWKWFDDFPKDWDKKQLKILSWVKDICNCVELHSTYNSIKSISNDIIKEYKKHLAPFKIVTLHLHKLIREFDNIRNFDLIVGKYVKQLKIKYTVVHADEYSKLRFKSRLPIAIESCDKRKKSHQHLQELNEFDLPAVPDICHVEEIKKGSFDKQISLVKNRIAEIHFSVPNADRKQNEIHCLAYESEYPLPKKIPKNVLWVIEGSIPKDRLDLLSKEVQLVEDYCS